MCVCLCVCNPIRAWHFIQVHNANTFHDLNFSFELFVIMDAWAANGKIVSRLKTIYIDRMCIVYSI